MEVTEIFDRVAGFFAAAAVVAFLLLLPLYFSQRRDVRRMRGWMELEPEYPPADIESSEVLLDRAEVELEELLGSQQEIGMDDTVVAPAAARVTSERPALERITMERAALQPHPRWRRFVAAATRPRVLVLIGIAALVLGGAGIFVSEKLLEGDGDDRAPRAARLKPSEVKVAVLNGTSINGLAGLVSSDVGSFDYELGAVTSTAPGAEKTIVLYADGQKPAAQRVARDLGVKEVKPIDRESRSLVGDADVVVVAGEDRAR